MKLKNVIILFISLLLLTCGVNAAGNAPASPEKCPGKVKVLVEKVVPGTFKEWKELDKRILPAKDYELINPTAGVIKTIALNVGSEVKKGDTILTLDSADIEKEIKEATARVKVWTKKLRTRQNWKVRSERAEMQAQTILAEAGDALKKAEEKLAGASILAPANGTIGTLNANIGDHISDNFVVGNVVDTKIVKIALSKYAANVDNGQELKISIKEIKLEAKGVVKKASDNAAAVFVKNTDGKILVGMSAKFYVLKKIHTNAVVVDNKMLMKDGDDYYVYMVNGKRASKTTVKTAIVDLKGNALISEGLAKDDEIIKAEILSAKEGSLKEAITCVQDGKKIKVMVKNEDAGNFVTRKLSKSDKKAKKAVTKKDKPKAVKKQKKKKKKARKSTRRIKREAPASKLALGLNLSYNSMSEANFKDVYGGIPTVGFDISYMLTNKIDLWATGAFGSKKGTLEDFPEADLTMKFTPITLNVRYFFTKGAKLDFLAGAGVNYYMVKETHNLDFPDVSENAIGFNLHAGTYYNLNEKLAVKLIFRFNMVKKTMTEETIENDMNLNNMELLFGFSYNL
ncbi:MAG: outer membrane beta-barrel protein [bacterium]|nr:outer membrane beta-barrel protein [bacterium]